MKLMILVLIFGVINCDARNNCCEPEQGLLVDDENYCVNINNVTTPTILKCKDVIHIVGIDEVVITPDHKLILSFVEGDEKIENGKYCIENKTRTIDETVIVVCSDNEVKERIVDESVYGYCMIVSAIFLVLVVFVYSLLPKMRDLQGKSIINFCISLTLGQLILGIMKATEQSNFDLCVTGSFFVYFFLLASFFWSNAITIQFFLTLGRPTVSDYSWRPFLWYALYAWGCPALLTTILVAVNYSPGEHQRPGIGLGSCWFYDNYQQWYYMYSVMSILIAVNICIFVYISVHLWRVAFSSNHVQAAKYKFWMTCKMCIIMGLPWIFEMISSLTEYHIIWVILDFFNLLQGLLLFLILVVFRRRVVKELYDKGRLQCIGRCVERHLAVGDDEEDVVEHTIGVALDDKL